MSRPWIVVAAPYATGARTQAERDANLATMNVTALELWRRGYMPIIGVNMALPVIAAAGGEDPGSEIMDGISFALVDRCDAAIRIGGPSRGEDIEVERCRVQGKPVYFGFDELPVLEGAGR